MRFHAKTPLLSHSMLQRDSKNYCFRCANLPPGPQRCARDLQFSHYLRLLISYKQIEPFSQKIQFVVIYMQFSGFSHCKLEIYAPGLTLVAGTCGHRRSIGQTLANKVTPRDFRFIASKPFKSRKSTFLLCKKAREVTLHTLRASPPLSPFCPPVLPRYVLGTI